MAVVDDDAAWYGYVWPLGLGEERAMDVYEWVVWLRPDEDGDGASLITYSDHPVLADPELLRKELFVRYGEGLKADELKRLEVRVRPF